MRFSIILAVLSGPETNAHETSCYTFIPHYEVTLLSTHCPDEEAEVREVKSLAQGYIAKLRFKPREAGCKGFRVQGLTT